MLCGCVCVLTIVAAVSHTAYCRCVVSLRHVAACRCCRRQRGSTALVLACFQGRLETAQWLVNEMGMDARSDAHRNMVRRSGVIGRR
jgi:hypothetical protein